MLQFTGHINASNPAMYCGSGMVDAACDAVPRPVPNTAMIIPGA